MMTVKEVKQAERIKELEKESDKLRTALEDAMVFVELACIGECSCHKDKEGKCEYCLAWDLKQALATEDKVEVCEWTYNFRGNDYKTACGYYNGQKEKDCPWCGKPIKETP